MNIRRRAGAAASRQPQSNTGIRKHLANERTLLAWVGTGVGLISVGFVVERAGALTSGTSPGGEAGLILVVAGSLLLAAAVIVYVIFK